MGGDSHSTNITPTHLAKWGACPGLSGLIHTGSRDTLKQVELKFPTLASAIRYAQRQGLCYVVDVPKDKARITMDKSGEQRNTFSDATLGKLGLVGLSDKYRRAMSNDANRNDGDGGWASPMDFVADNRLPLMRGGRS